MRNLTSLDLRYLVKEFQVLIGGKIQKIYQTGKEHFYFLFHITGTGKKVLHIHLPSIIFLGEDKLDSEQEPPHFSMMLRKRLSGGRVAAVKQKDFDRILIITVETKEAPLHVIIELFGGGNIILTDNDNKILSVLLPKKLSGRTLRGGVPYVAPESHNNILDMTDQEITETLKKSDKESLVKALAIDFGLGGFYAEEVLARSGIKRDEETIKRQAYDALNTSIHAILNNKISAVIEPTTKNIFPFKMESLETKQAEQESFSLALEHHFGEEFHSTKESRDEAKRNVKVDAVKKIIREQEETMISLKKKIRENEETANAIYEHYGELDTYLKDIKKAQQKLSLQDIQQKLKGHKKITSMDVKAKSIRITL